MHMLVVKFFRIKMEASKIFTRYYHDSYNNFMTTWRRPSSIFLAATTSCYCVGNEESLHCCSGSRFLDDDEGNVS